MSNYKDRLRTILGLEEKDKLTIEEKAVLFSKIQNSLRNSRSTKRLKIIIRIAATLAIFGGISLSLYLIQKNNKTQFLTNSDLSQTGIYSEGNGAILTLSDGSKINLTIQHNNFQNKVGNDIDISSDSLLRYKSPIGSSTIENKMNMIEVPKKYTFKIILADGTKVWLNSDSKLNYPTQFIGKERKVELIGEAYFEVASNKEKPFIVSTQNQEIQVLGTHFNVQSYPKKTITTSLLEGKIVVNSLTNNNRKTLLPGQQSQLNHRGEIEVKYIKNIEDFIEWKEGYFQLNGTTITDVMDVLSRWYDFDYKIANENDLRKIKLYGKIHKSAALDDALQILSHLDIHYNIKKSQSGQIEIILKNK